jgi:hypothetical protein
MTLRAKAKMNVMRLYEKGLLRSEHRFVPRSLPAAGTAPREGDLFEQTSLDSEDKN